MNNIFRLGNNRLSGEAIALKSTSTAGRIAGFDALRALAVFLVVGHHAAYRFPPAETDMIGQMLKHVGWIGVDIFFVISGFMITGILIRDISREDIRGFVRRRLFRIFPLFLVAISTYVVSALLFGFETEKLGYIAYTALLLNGWLVPFVGAEALPYTISWSLSVEEFAYLVLAGGATFGVRALRFVLLAFLVVAVVTRHLAVWSGAIDLFDLYFFVPARLDSIALGGFAALGLFTPVKHNRKLWLLSGLFVVGMIWTYQYTNLQNQFLPLIGYLAFAVAVGAFVAGIDSHESPGGTRLTRFIAPFGKLSYFVYLFHLFFLEAIVVTQSVLGVLFPYWLALLAACGLTFLAAKLSWRVFEYPLIRYSRTGRLRFNKAAK